MQKVYHLIIQGRVQRVWFRGWAVKTASEIGGIGGFVKNLNNGDVEILMKGSDESLQKMIALCAKGPTLARVDNIILKDVTDSLEFSEIDNIFTRK
ncbi:MAG: acylphosphatase [Alphaproteobacteria bacterium]